jgi:glycosyltransferase involved in cell wall biosynthesis
LERENTRICQVGDGESIHIKRWSKWLSKKGHEVTMLSLTPDRGNDAQEYDSWVGLKPHRGRFGYSRTALAVRRKLAWMKPDIAHGHYLTGAGFFTSIAKHAQKRIVSAWGTDVYGDTKVWAKRQCVKWAIKHSDVTLGDSDHIVNAVKNLVPGVDARKVIFGIDTTLFKPGPIKHDRFRFLSVRATGVVYNPMVIVEGFERAALDAELFMQEPQASDFKVKDYVNSKPELAKKVSWYGRRSYDEMPKLYNSCDVGISLPSWDSSSTAMNECMACGVPVIASEIPQNHEWVDGINGVFSPIDADALAQAMRSIYTADLKEMKVKARQKIVADGDFDTEMGKAERIYNEVLNGQKR